MKKTFFKAVKALFATAAAVCLASCSFISDGSSSSDSSTPVANGQKAVVTFSLQDPSRTAFPTVDLSGYTYTLSARAEGSDTATELLTEASLSSSATLSAEVEAGSYTFTVTAYSGTSAILQGSAAATIASANQTVSIKLAALSGGSGSVSVTLNYTPELGSKTVAKVTGAIYDEITATDSGIELTVSTGDDYSSVIYENASVASGATKYVIFFLYDSGSSLITSYTVPVYIVSGLATTAEETLTAITFTAQVTVQKDGEDWADSGLALSLVDGNGSETAMIASTGTALYTANVAGGTYTVYVGGNSKGVTVSADSTSASLNYDSDAVYPNMDTTATYRDTYFEIAFDSAPTINRASERSVRIYTADGTLVDTIKPAAETMYGYGYGGNSGLGSINVQYQLIQLVDTNKVRIIPHHNTSTGLTLLSDSTSYYVVIDDGLISGTLTGRDFTGLAEGEWAFTTASAPSVSGSTLTVGSDKNFLTVQGAFSYLMENKKTGDWTIAVDEGTYYERLFYSGSANITMSGKGSETYGSDVKIQWTNQDGGDPSKYTNTLWNYGSRGRNVFYFKGGNLVLENISFVNNATRKTNEYGEYDASSGSDTANGNNQAEALMFDSTGYVAAYNCSFTSKQDTVYLSPSGGKAWFYGCQISGDVDFIWGLSNVALFEKCNIISVYDSDKSSNHVTYVVASHFADSAASPYGKGFVLYNSTITTPNTAQTTYLARSPWGTDGNIAQVAIVNATVTGGLGSDGTYWYGNHVAGDADGNLVAVSADVDHSVDENILGWKSYGITLDGTALTDSTYGMESSMYAAEFAGRRNILNRVYNTTSKAFEAASSQWDIDSLISTMGWTVDADTSVADASAIIVGDGGVISDSDENARTDSLAITSSEVPSGYAGVSWSAPTYDATVVEVSTRDDLVTAAKAGGKIIVVKGMIDMTGGMLPSKGGDTTTELDDFVNTTTSGAYTTYSAWKAAYAAACTLTSDDEKSGDYNTGLYSTLWALSNAYKSQIQLVVASKTMIVGADSSSGIKGANISLSGVEYVTLRNLIIQDAYDPFPHHEVKSDKATSDGYNAQWDCITIQGDTSHVWIDHCILEDTLTLDHVYTSGVASDDYKEKWQTYDGLLDIKGKSEYITVSYTKFKNHDKTSLLGSDDSEGNDASSRLITYHHNYFYNCGQRLPMMRNGTFHLYNNVYAYSAGAYSQQYAMGVRSGSTVYAENNYFGSGIRYAFSAGSGSVGSLYASGNDTSSASNVTDSYISVTGTTLFSADGAPAAYTYTLDDISAVTDSSSGVAALAGSGDATINGNTYGSSTGNGTSYVTVTFIANAEDATITTSSQSVVSGSTSTLKTASALGLSRSGYSFTGWATSADSTTVAYEDGASITVSEATTLYAVWEAVVYYASGTYSFGEETYITDSTTGAYASSDGSVTGTGLTADGKGHGYDVASGSTITISVAGITQIDVLGCKYGNGAPFTAKVGDTTLATVSSCNVSTDGDVGATFYYTTDEAADIVITFIGTGWVHGIKVTPLDSFTAVTSITVTAADDATSVYVGGELHLTATTNSDATNQSVTWSSGDTATATVSSDGVVTGVADGSVTITATANDGSGVTGTYTVTVSTNTTEETGPWTWDWKSGTTDGTNIQTAAGTETTIYAYNTSTSLISSNVYATVSYIGTDGGKCKLADNGDNAQFNTNTQIAISVGAGQTLEVSNYPNYTSYVVGTTGSTTTDTTTPTDNAVSVTNSTSSAVTYYITATGNGYLYSITLSDAE